MKMLGKRSGAGFGFMYSQYKNAGKFIIDAKNAGNNYFKQKLTNPYTYGYGW